MPISTDPKYRDYKLPGPLEGALRQFGEWSDTQLLHEQNAIIPAAPLYHYTDLDAQITGPAADLNLGISTYVNGSPMNPIQIATNAVATDTIQYVATDQSGLTSTSTRTVIINTAPSIVPVADASTTTTTTATSSAP